jgi:hypothetical protein
MYRSHRLVVKVWILLSVPLLLYVPLILNSSPAVADCSETEMAAVFVVGDIYPGGEQALETLFVYLVEEATYPPEDELLAVIQSVQPCYMYILTDTIAPFRHYLCPPMDFGAAAIIDERNGQLPFAGTVIWSGWGEVTLPAESSHEWTYEAGEPAAEPVVLEIYPSELYYFIEAEVLAANVMAELRQTDVLHSFADCGDYSAVLYAYTPVVGALYPNAAKAVVIVSGLCGPPWNGEVVGSDEWTWSTVKSLYR